MVTRKTSTGRVIISSHIEGSATYTNLNRTFKELHGALKRVAEEIIESTIEQGGTIGE